MLIEVKPEATKHSVITAIGQIICYRGPFEGENNTLCILASKGTPADELVAMMKKYQINFMDLRRGSRQKLGAILSAGA